MVGEVFRRVERDAGDRAPTGVISYGVGPQHGGRLWVARDFSNSENRCHQAGDGGEPKSGTYRVELCQGFEITQFRL